MYLNHSLGATLTQDPRAQPPPTITATGLPSGITLSGRILNGTPRALGSGNIVITARNTFGSSSYTIPYRVTVAVAPSWTATSGAEQVWEQNQAVLWHPAEVDQGNPVRYSVSGLPAGMSFDDRLRVVSGTPRLPGSGTVTVTATNFLGSDTITYPWFVGQVKTPKWNTLEGPNQQYITGDAVTLTVPAVDEGLPPPTYTIRGLPAGLVFNATTRVISGTPTTAGTGRFVITATNRRGTAQLAYNWEVLQARAPAWVATSMTAVGWSIGDAVSIELPVLDVTGRPAATFTASTLPAGLTFNADGKLLSGTVEAVGTGTITFTATNRVGSDTITLAYVISPPTKPVWIAEGGADQIWNINRPITSITVPLPDQASAGATYTAAGLPTGIVFNATTRIISGTPTVASQGTITITATNQHGSDTYTYAYQIGAFQAVQWTAAGEAKRYLVRGEYFQRFYPEPDDGGDPFPAPTFTYANIPPGMQFNVLLGDRPTILSGRPTTNGEYNVVITATNTIGSTVHTDTFTIPIEVVDQPLAVADTDNAINTSGIPDIALSGLTFDGTDLIALDVFNDRIYGFDPATGDRVPGKDVSREAIREAFQSIHPTLPAESVEPVAVCFDGEALLVLDGSTFTVMGFAGGVHRPAKDIHGDVVRSVVDPAVGGFAQGICWDGSSVGISIAGNGIYFFTGGQVDDQKRFLQERMHRLIGGNPFVTGLAWDGSGLLVSDARNRRVRRFRGGVNGIDTARAIQASVIEAVDSGAQLAGVAWQPGSPGTVWVANRNDNTIIPFHYGDLTNFPLQPRNDDYETDLEGPLPISLDETLDGNGVKPDVISLLPADADLQGMTWDGESVLLLDNRNSRIYGFTRGARDTSKDIQLPTSTLARERFTGLAWDGTSILVARATNEVRAYTNGGYDADRSFTGNALTSQIGVARLRLRGITADPETGTFWVADRTDNIYAFTGGTLDTSKGQTAAQTRTAFANIVPEALTYDGRYLYVGGSGAVFAFRDAVLDSAFGVTSFVLARILNGTPLDPTDPDYVEVPDTTGSNRMDPRGLAFDGERLLVLDRVSRQVYSISRRALDPPAGSAIRYFARGLPDGVTFDPNTLDITGAPREEGSGTAVITAINITGRDVYRFDWTVVQEFVTDITYRAEGLPRGVVFNPATLTLDGVPLDEDQGVIIIHATNDSGADQYRIPYRTVIGNIATPVREQSVPTSLRVHWPNAGTEVVDGIISASKKTLVLHDNRYNQGPALYPSSCILQFAEEDRPQFRTLGQLPISDRLLNIPPETPVDIDVLDQHGAIWWQGVLSDQFEVDKASDNTLSLTLDSTLTKLNRSEPPTDLIFLNKPIWGTASTYQDSVLYHLLVNQYGLTLEPSDFLDNVPLEPPAHTVIPVKGPDQGEVVWDALRGLLLKYGLVLYPNAQGTRYRIERLSDRTATMNHEQDDPDPPWTISRQQTAVRSFQASYATTASYLAKTTQHIGTVWRAGEGFILPGGESWPSGASETNIVPIAYTPAQYEPEPLGQLGKVLGGATILGCVNPHTINTPGGVTVRRANLHSLWADLWLVNNNPFPVLFQGFRIDADDVLYVEDNERLASSAGDPLGKGILSLSKDFLERRGDALAALETMREWVAGRTYLHNFTWVNPDWEVMDLSADFIMIGGILMRPIKITESRYTGNRRVTIVAESARV